MTPFEAELSTARDAAEAAAGIILAREGATDVREKAPGDLVTAVDEAAERCIVDRIRERFPADGIVAEESAAENISRGRRWIIDPVDGTTNYVHRHPFVCVSVALVDDDGPAVGVVHAPYLNEVYHAVRGGGAFLSDERVRVSLAVDPARSLFATGFPFRSGKGDPHRYMALVADVVTGAHGLRRAGSAALDLAYVAAGRLEGFFEMGLSPWDIAAGMLLVTEAGGRVTGWRGDAELPLETGRIVASNGRLHDWLFDVVERHEVRLPAEA